MPNETSSPIPPRAELAYVVGIDIGMESCMMCCLTMDKRQVIKPSKFSNEADGFEWLFEHLYGDCVRKQTVWMLRPLRGPYSVERHALATFPVIKW